MRVAIAKDSSGTSGHFGHCLGFEVYNIEENKIVSTEFLKSPGHTPGALPKLLAENNVNVIVSGGMGKMAQDLFTQNGISVVVGASGSLETVINDYLEGKLVSTNSICEEHAHRGEGIGSGSNNGDCEGH